MNLEEMNKLGLIETGKTTCEDQLYSLKEFEGEEVERGDFILRVFDNGWVNWVLLEAHTLEDPKEYVIYVEGCGTGYIDGFSLREARHTYFGKDGYIFYVKPDALTWCFDNLKKWFDFD